MTNLRHKATKSRGPLLGEKKMKKGPLRSFVFITSQQYVVPCSTTIASRAMRDVLIIQFSIHTMDASSPNLEFCEEMSACFPSVENFDKACADFELFGEQLISLM